MSEEVTVRQRSSASHAPPVAPLGFWLDRIARAFARTNVPFEMSFPDGEARRFGQGVAQLLCQTEEQERGARHHQS